MRFVFDVTPLTGLVGVVAIVLSFLYLFVLRQTKQRTNNPTLQRPQQSITSTKRSIDDEEEGQETEADAEEDLNNNNNEEEKEKEGGSGVKGGHDEHPHIPLVWERLPIEESLSRSQNFYRHMNSRRTVRMFSY